MKKNISVIMGIYNCRDTLPQAIDSIVAQTYPDWELIMCDDCSTDDTYEVAKKYLQKYPEKIKLIKNKKNSRLSFSLNHCLEYAEGKYIARMDGDDISAPDRFEKQIKYLESHPDVQLVGTSMQQFNDKDGNIKIIEKPEKTNKWMMKEMTPFNHATIMTYKTVYDELGGYTVAERTKRGQDIDLWFRFFAEGFVGDNISEALYFVREDMNAIKRRTFKSRWEIYQTKVYGYKLLCYPKTWIVKEFFVNLVKSITPYRIQYLYRKYQQKNN